jgi:hypothetical protein
MGYKSKIFAGERVELSAGYWARVRPLNGDEALALAESVAASTNGATSSGNRASLLLLLTTAVIEWNIDDEAGAVLPITAENVAELSATDQMKIVMVARTLNNPLDEQAKGN